MGSVDRALIAACGLDCGGCDVYVACTNRDLEKMEEIAEQISRQFQVEIGPEQIICGGCHGPAEEQFSVGCKIRPCAEARGLVTCAECDEVESCGILQAFHGTEMGQSAKANLERIREIGLEAWVKERKARG